MANPCHKQHLVALKRIAGQVSGVQRMIEDNKYCIDILTQLSAVRGALGRVEEKILRTHLENCVTHAIQGKSKTDRQDKLDEIIKLIHQARK